MTITFEYQTQKYTIDFDGSSYTPRKLWSSENKNGAETERSKDLGYFNKLGSAIDKIVRQHLGSSEETISLLDFVNRYEKASADIKRILESEF